MISNIINIYLIILGNLRKDDLLSCIFNSYRNITTNNICETYDFDKNKWFNFIDYAIDHNKIYENKEEIINRFNIYNDNIKYIESIQQSNSNLTYKLGINKFTDLTHNEYISYVKLGFNEKKNNNVCKDIT